MEQTLAKQSPDRLPLITRAGLAGTTLFLVIVCLVLMPILTCLTQAHATETKSTLVLPLKINSSVDKEKLTELVDKALQKALASTSVRAENFHLMTRAEAQGKFDYKAAWPPPVEVLKTLAIDGEKYIAAGSITRLGTKISLDIKVFDLLDPSSPDYFFLDVKNIDDLSAGIDKIVNDILAHTGKQFLIAGVAPQGNDRIDSGAILHQVKSRAGDIYDPATVQADLKNIFKMGYFDDVKIRVKDTDKGKEIVFEVKEKPVIGRILIKGAKKLEEETIREAIPLVPNTIFNPRKANESVGNILAIYKEKGFYNTEVSSELRYPKPEKVDIHFKISEGAKVFIKKIKLVGNNSFKARKLLKIIRTSKKGLFYWFTDSGVLKKDILEQDAGRLAAFYHNLGYIEAKVGEPEVVQEGEWLYITLKISEGARYRVGKVELSGELIDDKKVLLDLIKIREEEFLSRKILREDILRLSDFYSENGFAFAEVTPEVEEKGKEKVVDIVLNIKKHNLVHLNRITIKGNTRTRDKVIRRELEIKEGGLFNSAAIRKSHKKLRRLNYFEDISITPQQAQEKDLMDVLVEVKEKPTGAFSVGAGYSSVDNMMVMGEVSQNNLLGKGQRLAFQANISSRTNRYNISFTEPHLNDSKLLVGFSLYNWTREYDDYTKDSYGGAIRFGYPIWKLWRLGFGYGYDNADLTNVKTSTSWIIRESQNIHITSYITLGLSRDTRDSFLDANKGSNNAINIKYAGGPLGGDSAFTKLEGSSSWYFPMPKETTFHIKGTAGVATENSGGKLPVYEKFYLGGINTIRGFTHSHISPLDPVTGERIGGTKMWYTNTEWLFPLAKEAGLKGLVFFDAGNVYDNNWDLGQIKKSVGTGFRWLSPMGPLRLEWGYVIDPAPDEDQSNWDFSIGGVF